MKNTVTGAVLFLALTAVAWSQTTPPSPVTEGALRQLCSERDRVIVVLSAKDVWVALRAASVTQIDGATLVIGMPADNILVENKVHGGGSERRPNKEDVLEVVTRWFPPFDGTFSNWFLERSNKAGKLEYMQFTKAQTVKGLRIEVQEILTWFCPEPGPQCHVPEGAR